MPRRKHLRSLLAACKPADARESDHLQRIVRLLDETAAPFARDQYVPGHVTASGFVLNAARDSLLLILHAKLHMWLQPGGHVEPDDVDVAHAAAREIREEVGLLDVSCHGVLDVDVHAIPAHGSQPAHEHFDVRFLFTTRDGRVSASSEVRAARWAPISALLQGDAHASHGVVHDESVLRAVRKLSRAEA